MVISCLQKESTKYTPFEIMFGRKARLPIDIDTGGITEPSEKLKEFIQRQIPVEDDIQKARTNIEEVVKLNIERAQQKQKECYDKKHNALGPHFDVGCLVLKKDFTKKKRKEGKLDSGGWDHTRFCHPWVKAFSSCKNWVGGGKCFVCTSGTL